MLILSRLMDEMVVINCRGVEIRLKVVELRPGQVRLGFDAPLEVEIDRLEVYKSKQADLLAGIKKTPRLKRRGNSNG